MASELPSDYTELERGTAVHYAACGGIWVMTIFATPHKADMLLARPALQKMEKWMPGGFSTLTWVLFSELEPAIGWCLTQVPQRPSQSAADLTQALESARQRLRVAA